MNGEYAKWVHSLAVSGASSRQAAWEPAADIYRTERGWLVKFDLAGVSPDQVQVVVRGCTLTVQGERRDEVIRECRQSYSMEISYNRFQRTMSFPCEVDQAKVTTEYRNGMLLVHLETEAEK